ncbi:ectoine/hydroxyectoine ABC transporter permease subunit EhuD [Sporosarcina pasteurii]|uniref:Inner membrane amino-acid ABC transporter permease protein yecS n=1 Tax=Sporosarcina pasteurii TaxID=1474 RepID=A0A380C1N6_SPOPA|nr:ectoine/hydroxyectoine ABC transporter permease subunit EhuD [Sporosarcina pasteurii]MDS9471567.1 ectoine/hydroxyectoine ABC transporter permease subunit EhuD [Sporosarcina pasteurii]QBQ04818.1 ectoine/hydroxyectoine ABC transporter permease subunit EhuD [Sporosarcina pasteurii]SUJ11131.1 Inner membrane amino-acid ABC transporter permease protein yecS [Sporosarcina pasteurii]
MIWSWEVFFDVIPIIFKGMWITLGLTIACYLFAVIFGFFWLLMDQVPSKVFRWTVRWIAEFIRSTPPLVQLFFIYYAWPMVPVVGVSLNPFAAAILGLGIHFSTYLSEVYRSGIESVEKGQWEAATALNLSTSQKWLKVILPQAIPPTIPMLGNYLIIMFKEVPLASTIGVVAMLHLANDYGAQYYKYVEPLTVVALFFLLLSYPSALLIKKLEIKFNRRFDKKYVTES